MLSFKAWIDGLRQVARAPLLILLTVIVTVAVAAPFAMVLGGELRAALADQPPIALGSSEIDADWWNEFRSHAGGLAATFTPTVIGFAAPLDNLSAIADGTRRPAVLIVPIAAGVLAWALLWGIVLHRFDRRGGLSISEAASAAFTHFPRFVVISAAAAAAQLLLYLTIHPLLFGAVYRTVASDVTPESGAFAYRLLFYAIFGIPVVAISLTAEYARVAQVVTQESGIAASIGTALRFIRRHWRTAAALYLFNTATFAIVMTGHGVIDSMGGTRVAGWRGVLIGQAFIVARLAMRLVSGASSLELFKKLRG